MTNENPDLNRSPLHALNREYLEKRFGWKHEVSKRFGGSGDRYQIGSAEEIILESYPLARRITLQIPETDKMDSAQLNGIIAMQVDEVKVNEEEIIFRRRALNGKGEMIISITQAGEITMLRGKNNDFEDSKVANKIPPSTFSQAVELTPPVGQGLKERAM